MSRESLPCGCRHDGVYWLRMCDFHTQERAEYTAAFFEHRSVRPEAQWLVVKPNIGAAEGLV